MGDGQTDGILHITVAPDGSGDCRAVQDAVDAVPKDYAGRTVIHIRPGIYRQKVKIEKPRISLEGEDAESTVMTWNDSAGKMFSDGEKCGTFRSYSTYISGDGFTAENITFENTAGKEHVAGQALAASVMADRAFFRGCRFLGCQDTLFTGPLPPASGLPDGFRGPDEYRPRKDTRQYYEHCLIRGDVDFIFGSATAVFSRCRIDANERERDGNGYLTAASTPKGKKYGYVFLDCDLTGRARPGTYYLGRPWRDFAKTVYIRCHMGLHIRPEGFCDWHKPQAAASTVFYAEYGCAGPGARLAGRAPWVRRLTDEEAGHYTIREILFSDGWNPADAGVWLPDGE